MMQYFLKWLALSWAKFTEHSKGKRVSCCCTIWLSIKCFKIIIACNTDCFTHNIKLKFRQLYQQYFWPILEIRWTHQLMRPWFNADKQCPFLLSIFHVQLLILRMRHFVQHIDPYYNRNSPTKPFHMADLAMSKSVGSNGETKSAIQQVWHGQWDHKTCGGMLSKLLTTAKCVQGHNIQYGAHHTEDNGSYETHQNGCIGQTWGIQFDLSGQEGLQVDFQSHLRHLHCTNEVQRLNLSVPGSLLYVYSEVDRDLFIGL